MSLDEPDLADLAKGADGGEALPDLRADPELERILRKYQLNEREIERDFDPYRYVPPGPVARSFILDEHLSPFIMGPVGAGKTVTAVFKRIVAGTRMPACNDGVIRDRFVVVRSTYRDAEKTVLASWLQWFPRTYPGSSWSGGNDRPAIHILRFRTQHGQRVELITEFIGLNGQRVEDRLRGYEISGAWMNEADTMDEDALRYLEQRTGRYPKRDLLPAGARRVRQVIGDLNAPDIDNWVYKVFVEKPTENRVLYAQPSGLSAEAENIKHLEPGYYEQMAADNEDWFVRRMVHNQFGYSRDGKPVYDTFNPRIHVAPRPLAYDPKLPLLIGLDGGGGTLNPAAIIGQLHAGWQLRILRELVPGHGYGPSRFGELLAAEIEQHFPGAQIRAWADPASQYGADREGGQLAWNEIVGVLIGAVILIPFDGSNEISLRTDAVKAELKTDGKDPNMLISPTGCPILVRGFASGYKFAKRTDGQFEATPAKNAFSHPHDGLQYLVGGVRGRTAIVTGAGRGRNGPPGAQGRGGWPAGGAARAKGNFDPHKVG
ncbi:hypothetical protein [Kaistia sp. MMO-174]|uniref:hypothetical protein n=1 Tax=Kaistia sp. MMO-174 TaxID=3081256 RepID=UPI0030194CBF